MVFPPPARHLLRAKDLADARYYLEFRRTFGESPHAYVREMAAV